jgi:hypothetical protein
MAGTTATKKEFWRRKLQEAVCNCDPNIPTQTAYCLASLMWERIIYVVLKNSLFVCFYYS